MKKSKNNLVRFAIICLGIIFIQACSDDDWNPGQVDVKGDFDFTLSQEKAPAVVTFTDKSTNGFSYLWKFPGGEPAVSMDKNPVVTYKAGGTYEVTLNVGNGTNMQTVTKSLTLQTPDVVPAFDYVYADGNDYAPATVTFTDKTSGGATSWAWTFTGGDPAASYEQNPVSVLFTGSGKFPVNLKVSNEKSAEETTEYVKAYPTELLCSSPTEEIWITPLVFMGMEIGSISLYLDKERKDPVDESKSKSIYRLYISAEAAALLGEKGPIDYILWSSWEWDVTDGVQNIAVKGHIDGIQALIKFDIASLSEEKLVFSKIDFDPILNQALPEELLQAMGASTAFTKVKPK